MVAGADGPQTIGVWSDSNQTWSRKHLKLSNGIPSHGTLGRLLATLKPKAFQACFQDWIQSVSPLDEDTGTNQIAIDGKVLRSSHDRSKGLGLLWLVSSWAVDRLISLGQFATEEKSNEITATPELLDSIEIKGAVVTIDAVGCQREIAKKIIEGEGDDVLALKENQETLHDAVTE